MRNRWLVFSVVWFLLAACGGDDGNGTENNNNNGQPECGNGIAEAGELCDSDELNSQTCQTLGHVGGTLHCSSTCGFDLTDCVDEICGNGTAEATEPCDGSDLAGATCVGEGYEQGELACDSTCRLDTSGCALCGNDVQETNEVCDGTDLNSMTCEDLGFDGGTLSCDTGCQFVNTLCTTCGDDTLEAGEQCDGALLGGATCVSLGHAAGTLTCTTDCTYNVTQCGACDTVQELLNQAGCVAGEACTVVDGAGTIGCHAAGAVADYQPCTGVGDCLPGALCAGSSSTECLPFCDLNGPTTACPGNGVCASSLSTTDGMVGLCIPSNSCDPLAQTGCSTGQACYLMAGGSSICATAGTVPVGSNCQYVDDCVGGAMCAGSPGVCHEICNAAFTCASGTCQGIGTFPSFPTIGVCQ